MLVSKKSDFLSLNYECHRLFVIYLFNLFVIFNLTASPLK